MDWAHHDWAHHDWAHHDWAHHDWAHHAPQFRFDIRAEREECEPLRLHQASVPQDRMARRTRTDRTKHPATPEWEKIYQTPAQERRLMHQARVLSWGKEKHYYFTHKTVFESA